jgi:hypothetical protein
MVSNKIPMTIILCMLQQQGDNGKVRTSAALSASRQSSSTVTSSSVPAAPSKPQTLSEEENMSNDGTQDSSKVRHKTGQVLRQESSYSERMEWKFIILVFILERQAMYI